MDKSRNMHGKKYDFFVSFSKNDAEWVYYSLLLKLEEKYKFKGCVADRDFVLGTNTMDAIIDAIQNSVCTILVLTPEYCNDQWCGRELDRAICVSVDDDKHNVIPLLLKKCEMPTKLKYVVRLNAIKYFKWEKVVRDIELHCGL